MLSAPDGPKRGGLSPVRVLAALPDPADKRRASGWGSAPRGIGEGLPFLVEMEGGC